VRIRIDRSARAFTSSTVLIEGERTVLDVVFIAGILALIALVAAVAKGVERL
jgi:hypothetical protein